MAKNELRFCADVFLRFEVESVENGGSVSDNRRLSERSVEDLAKNVNHSSTHGMTRAARALTVRWVISAVHPKTQGSLLSISTQMKKPRCLDIVLIRYIQCSSFVCSPPLHIRISNLTYGRKTMRNTRLATQRDDVHLCIMCLRAIMNYQVCWREENIQTQGSATQMSFLENFVTHHVFLMFFL